MNVKKSRDIGGKYPLLICSNYFKTCVKVPTSGGSSNISEKKEQRNTTNSRKLKVALNGRRKYKESKKLM